MRKLLLIENDADVRDMVTFAFENNGFEVIKTGGGDPVAEAASVRPDVIIIAYQLADVPGDSLCRQLKCDERTGAIPIILFSTGLNVEKIAPRGYADALVAKPFELEDLVHLGSRLAHKN